MATRKIARRGFGQVELNLINGNVEGRIRAQLPIDTTKMGSIIENGRFAKYDYATGKVNLTGAGEWMMIYNEEKLYDERKQQHKDYAMIKTNFTDGEMVPRLIASDLGDIITLNTFGANETGADSELTAPITTYDNGEACDVDGITLTEGTAYQFAVNKTTGYLMVYDSSAAGDADADGPIYELVKITTMADGQPGLKLHRIK